MIAVFVVREGALIHGHEVYLLLLLNYIVVILLSAVAKTGAFWAGMFKPSCLVPSPIGVANWILKRTAQL